MSNQFTIPRRRFQRILLGFFGTLAKLWWMTSLFLLVGLGFCTHYQCTAHDETREILERDGYRVIELGNHAWFSCSEDDAFSNSFTAKKDGKTARGSVCCGILKNCTIRWE